MLTFVLSFSPVRNYSTTYRRKNGKKRRPLCELKLFVIAIISPSIIKYL